MLLMLFNGMSLEAAFAHVEEHATRDSAAQRTVDMLNAATAVSAALCFV